MIASSSYVPTGVSAYRKICTSPRPPTCAPAVSGVVHEGEEASSAPKHLDVGMGVEAEVGRGRTQHLVLQVQGGGARGRDGEEAIEMVSNLRATAFSSSFLKFFLVGRK